MLDVFFKEPQNYTEKLDPLKEYIRQVTFYIQTKHKVDEDKAKQIATDILKKHLKDKAVKYFSRAENGDKSPQDTTLLKYIYSAIKENKILTPTFTTYLPKSTNNSILSQFINQNVKIRSQAKKEAQKAKSEGNNDLYIAKNNEQNNMKIYNNSLSGAFAQEACILHNPTGHSTLTSITRTITSLSNASNEKLVAGNRFYSRPIEVLNDIIYISSTCDTNKIRQAMELYSLYQPTVQDVVDVLKYSSDLYFIDNRYYSNKVVPLLESLTKEQLAAICYCGDLYHIRKYNSDFIRNFIKDLIRQVPGDNSQEALSKIHSINENILNFVHQIYYSKVKGFGKDYNKMASNGLTSDIYATSLNIMKTLQVFKPFFNAFFLTNILPANSHKLVNMLRRVVVLSDTDSTCFTLDEWVKWYHGDFYINDETIAASCSVGFIASQAIIHQLALFSSYMNVDKGDINKLAMKNEFLWLAHVPANVSKHYFAYTVMQEGNVFSEPDIEIKGVHLKNSAVPKEIIQDAKEIMKYITSTVASNNKLKFYYVLDKVISLEKQIMESVQKSETKYLKRSKIKNKEAYALEEDKSPFQRHKFWMEVFDIKYGPINEPPYDVVKIPTIVTSKKEIKNWVESIEDTTLAKRLNDWLIINNKDRLETIYLSEEYVKGYGIPVEIIKVVDIKRIVLDLTMQHRVILETLGVLLDEETTVSEQFASTK